jgi:hypothetical protein
MRSPWRRSRTWERTRDRLSVGPREGPCHPERRLPRPGPVERASTTRGSSGFFNVRGPVPKGRRARPGLSDAGKHPVPNSDGQSVWTAPMFLWLPVQRGAGVRVLSRAIIEVS